MPDPFRLDEQVKCIMKGIAPIPVKYCQAWGINHLSRKPVALLCQMGIYITSILWIRDPAMFLTARPPKIPVDRV